MASTVEELMAAGLTKAEAERVINRKAKAAKSSASQITTAEKRLPKLQELLDHAADRAAHWSNRASEIQAKIDKNVGIISGETSEEAETDSE